MMSNCDAARHELEDFVIGTPFVVQASCLQDAARRLRAPQSQNWPFANNDSVKYPIPDAVRRELSRNAPQHGTCKQLQI